MFCMGVNPGLTSSGKDTEWGCLEAVLRGIFEPKREEVSKENMKRSFTICPYHQTSLWWSCQRRKGWTRYLARVRAMRGPHRILIRKHECRSQMRDLGRRKAIMLERMIISTGLNWLTMRSSDGLLRTRTFWIHKWMVIFLLVEGLLDFQQESAICIWLINGNN
jgi:hypothetical protein